MSVVLVLLLGFSVGLVVGCRLCPLLLVRLGRGPTLSLDRNVIFQDKVDLVLAVVRPVAVVEEDRVDPTGLGGVVPLGNVPVVPLVIVGPLGVDSGVEIKDGFFRHASSNNSSSRSNRSSNNKMRTRSSRENEEREAGSGNNSTLVKK